MRLIESLATTEELAALFSDESILCAMLEFEVALARAEARVGVIAQTAAAVIERVARAGDFDTSALARDSLRAGTPGIPLVAALTERVRAIDPSAARFVHWGTTSQDVADTALVLLLGKARSLLAGDHSRLESALRRLSGDHRDTVMLGRTLLQPAPPVTFGLKAAQWLAASHRGWIRLDQAFEQLRIVQFGGASGTLAALGDQGIAVGMALAEALGLDWPEAPWHGQRDRLGALVTACGIQTASLGKMARDIALLMQGEIAEAAEAGGSGRGGSSTMPHKRNPIACAMTLAAAHRVPGLVAAFLSAMVQEHERGVGGWQSEWSTVSAVVQSTGLAIASMAEAAEALEVDRERMRANINATGGGVFAERVTMVLGSTLGRDAAHALLEQATRKSVAERRALVDVLGGMPEVTRHLSKDTLRDLDSPEAYLGMAETFRRRLISSTE